MSASWIPLLVPREDYLDLAREVADRLESRGESTSLAEFTAVTRAVDGGDQGAIERDARQAALDALVPWDLADLRRLATSSFTTAQRWARAMDVCSRHINMYLSTREVATEAGLTVNEWRDAPRKLPRHLDAHYPSVKGRWPLAVRSGSEIGINDGQVYWAINDTQAARWLEVREAQS